MTSQRGLTPAGRASVEGVARRHLESGLHSGAQLAVYRDGELQVDLRIGSASSPESRMLWFSATKPLAAVAVLMLAERGQLDLDAPIAELWPEFGAGGKQACTVRHVLTHRGGFPVFPWDYDWAHIDDWDAVCAVTAAIEAEWAPGEDTGYHPVTYGFALGEVIRRVDGRAPRDFLLDEVFGPLGMDASLGIEEARLPDVVPVEAMSEVTMLDPTGSERRTSDIVRRFRLPSTLRAQMPAANAIGTAEALARFYDAMLDARTPRECSTRPRLLSAETAMRATTRQWRTNFDRTFMLPASYGLGFLVGGAMEPYNQPGVFGHSGQQSTIGYADPQRGLAVAYVTNGLHGPLEVQMRYADVALALIAACEEADGRSEG
ncbi:MAG: beta-lactamase family protein [Chloroflexi bacterium]|nr:beta-lactamase family protein [Chloroflexota bacterium]